MSVLRKFVLVLACLAALLSAGGGTPTAEAAIGKPNYFPSFSSAGTVLQITAPPDSPNAGTVCTVFLADSDGSLYYFNGLDGYTTGTRLHVRGNLCTICSAILTCGQPVSPILNAVVIEL